MPVNELKDFILENYLKRIEFVRKNSYLQLFATKSVSVKQSQNQ